MKPWFLNNPSMFVDFKNIITKEYPGLELINENNVISLEGIIFLKKGSKIYDKYEVRIEIPCDFPKSVPLVWETGHRIPKDSSGNRHFNPADGTACLFVPEERYRFFPETGNIREFIENAVRPFFKSQTYYEKKGDWPFGQLPHGHLGRLDFWADELGIDNNKSILKFLEYVIKKEIKGHWRCYCDSGKALRDCHINKINEVKSKIPRNILKKSYEELSQFI